MARKKSIGSNLLTSDNTQSAEETLRIQQLKMMDLKILGKRLRQVRIDKDISQRALTGDLFTSAYLSSIELGKTRPTLTTLYLLAERLGENVTYFLRPASFQAGAVSGARSESGDTRFRDLLNKQHILRCEVALSRNDWEEAELELTRLESSYTDLNSCDQSFFHLLKGSLSTSLGNPQQALEELQLLQAKLALAGAGDEEENAKRIPGTFMSLEVRLELELGHAHHALGNYAAALEHFLNGLSKVNGKGQKQGLDPSPALQDASESETGYWQQELLFAAARSYQELGDFKAAAEYLERGLNGFSPTSQEALAQKLLGEAEKLAERGDFQSAAFLLGQSREIAQNSRKSFQRQDLALKASQLYFQLGNYSQARRAAAAAAAGAEGLTAFTRPGPGTGSDLISEARVYRTKFAALLVMAEISLNEKDVAQTESLLNRAASLLEEVSLQEALEIGPLETGHYYLVSARFFALKNENEKAYEFCQRAISLLEPLSNQGAILPVSLKSLMPLLAEIYYQASQLLKDRGELELGITYLEKAYRLR